MLDIKKLRLNTKDVFHALKKRGVDFDIEQFSELEKMRKTYQVEAQNLQNLRNKYTKDIAQKKRAGEAIEALLNQTQALGVKIHKAKKNLENIFSALNNILLYLPNIAHASVPIGKDKDDNVVVSKWGEVRNFDFEIKDHITLGALHNELNFKTAAKIAGARFALMHGGLAKLHRGLIQWMLDTHIHSGYEEVYTPYLVNKTSLIGTGQLPKFASDLFKTHLHSDEGEAKDLYLTPTAEVPLTNIVRDVVIDSDDLPRKYVAHTPCFRREAGAYGRDTRGLIRQHQFEKVELVHIAKPEKSYMALETLTMDAENILRALKLPYQKVALCTGDLGFAAAKTYDLEVWLPAQNTYREISSCTNCTDFQARRLKARWKNLKTGENELVHTLNGSGLAVGRTLVAIMENYQTKEGDIIIPDALKNYLGGLKILTLKK